MQKSKQNKQIMNVEVIADNYSDMLRTKNGTVEVISWEKNNRLSS